MLTWPRELSSSLKRKVSAHTQTRLFLVSKLLMKAGKKVKIQTGDKVKEFTVDTILVALGRDCNPASMHVDKAGVKFNEKSNKIVGRKEETERTNIDHIYAVGDILEGVPELMPVA